MKVFLQILAFCFIYNVSLSQENNFLATYKIEYIPINFDSVLKSNHKKGKKNAYKKGSFDIGKKLKLEGKQLQKIRFFLEFNKDQSVFYKQPVLDNDAKKMQLISIVFGILDQKYFVNFNEVIIQKNSYGEDFLVEIPKINWTITKEKRKIGNYFCYKAISQIEKNGPKGKQSQNIIAWFAPEIPFNYGPKYYAGLPGLIVKLKEGENLVYRLEKVSSKRYKKLKPPKEGKRITLHEFNILSKKMYEDLKNQ